MNAQQVLSLCYSAIVVVAGYAAILFAIEVGQAIARLFVRRASPAPAGDEAIDERPCREQRAKQLQHMPTYDAFTAGKPIMPPAETRNRTADRRTAA